MKRQVFAVAASMLLTGSALAQDAADSVAPEVASALAEQVPQQLRAAQDAKISGKPTEAQNWMVAAAHPLAVAAGSEVLADGGTAATTTSVCAAILRNTP